VLALVHCFFALSLSMQATTCTSNQLNQQQNFEMSTRKWHDDDEATRTQHNVARNNKQTKRKRAPESQGVEDEQPSKHNENKEKKK
jgi:hypothetical protein